MSHVEELSQVPNLREEIINQARLMKTLPKRKETNGFMPYMFMERSNMQSKSYRNNSSTDKKMISSSPRNLSVLAPSTPNHLKSAHTSAGTAAQKRANLA